MKKSYAFILFMVLCLGLITPGLGQGENISGTRALQSGRSAQASTQSEATATPGVTAQPTPLPELTRVDCPVDYGTWVSSRFRIDAPDAFERLQWYSEEEADQGEALARIAYPYEWPTRYLRGALPEYKGQGWIADLRLIYPFLSTEAECVRSLSWTMYEYKPEELEAFILNLRKAGYAESTDEELLAQAREMYTPVSTSYGLLVKDGVRFHYYTAQNGPMMNGLMADLIFPEGLDDSEREAIDSVKNEGSGDYVHFSFDLLNPKEPNFDLVKDTQLKVMKSATPNEVVFEDIYEESIREVVYGAPSTWPKEDVGNLIPEYTLPGMLSNFQLTTHKDKPEGQNMLMATIYIQDAPKSAFENYAEQLVAHGYRRVAPEQYHERDTAVAQKRKECAVFFYPGLRCYLSIDDQTGEDILVISLQHDGRLMEFYN